MLRDRVTGATAVHLSFEDFTLALQTALLDGAVIYNLGRQGSTTARRASSKRP